MSAPPELRVHRDPLRPTEYATHRLRAGTRVIDALTEHYPAGFGRPVRLMVNGAPLAIADTDLVLLENDLVAVLVPPAGQAVGALIVQALVSAAIAAIATVVTSLIFKPKRPNSLETPAPDPIYSISGAQNAARIGEPVPVLYGQMVTVPDFASQPYVEFSGNDQYLNQILVIGQGDYDLADVLVGETPVSALQSNAVQYWLIPPATHGQAIGNIEAATGIMENVVTSPEVGDQELTGAPMGDVVSQSGNYHFRAANQINLVSVAPPAGYPLFTVSGSTKNNGSFTIGSYDAGNQRINTVEAVIVDEDASPPAVLTFFHTPDQKTTGPFITSKPGTLGNRLMLDFVWPGGLYQLNSKNGTFQALICNFTIQYQLVDAAGAPVGGWISQPISESAATNTPLRKTYKFDVAAGRYRVRVVRDSPLPANAEKVANFIWTGLKFRLMNAAPPVYGPVTLLAIRIRATNGIAANASSRIRAKITRKLPRLGAGAAIATTSPADAFVDIYCNQVYGARRPLSEVDLAELSRIEASWLGLPQFNGGFAQRSTIWEALNIVLQTANAAPLPLGQLMSIAQEGVKATRRQLFSDANMVRGSLAVGYSFDKPGDYDGIDVEYRDPTTWNALHVIYPPGALDTDQVQLFGCSNGDQAAGFARLLWQKRLTLRKTCHFETELEGLLARMGDRIAVSADLPRWGMSGVVVGQQGLVLWLDKPPDWTGSAHLIVLRDQYGVPSDPIAVTPGPEQNTVQLAGAPPFAIFGTGGQEPTHYAFGDTVQLVRDFTVQSMEPRGGASVGIEALAYDPAAFAGTLPWLLEAT